MSADQPNGASLLSPRIPHEEQQRLLRRLARESREPVEFERRVCARYAYHADGGLVLELQQPGGSRRRQLAWPRNLSDSGVALLQAQYVHAGSRCRVHLTGPDGTERHVRGQVVRCRHVSGCAHEIGVRFDEPIDAAALIGEKGHSQTCAADTPIGGRLLCVGGTRRDRAHLNGCLRATAVEMRHHADPLRAVQSLRADPADWVLLCPPLRGLSPGEFVKMLRAAQVRVPTLLAPDPAADADEAAAPAGVEATIERPFARCALLETLKQHA